MRSMIILSAISIAVGAYLLTRQQGQTIDLTSSDTASTDKKVNDALGAITDIFGNSSGMVLNLADKFDGVTMGLFNLSGMKNAKPEMLANANVKAFLAVIRKGEGTYDANGYRRLFGGQLFISFADHPRVTVKAGGYTSTAAGAYQFLSSVWDETKNAMNLKDFSPANQDLAALGRIAARGALDDVIAGRFTAAVQKCAKEWASLPFSPYGQPTQTLAAATQVFAANGGTITV
jgi:muramidase (phage lysozyme)